MTIVTRYFSVKTRGETDVIDITDGVALSLRESGLKNGTLTVFVPGSTAGITTTEFEPGLIKDLPALFEKLVPRDSHYNHDLTWGDGNGFSHLRAALLKSFFTVPFVDGKMILGIWQQLILIDFDNRHRNREIAVQIMGE